MSDQSFEQAGPRPAGTISVAFVLSLVLVPTVIVTGWVTDRSPPAGEGSQNRTLDTPKRPDGDLGLRKSLPDDVARPRPKG